MEIFKLHRHKVIKFLALMAALTFSPCILPGQEVTGDIPGDKHAGFQENIIPPSPGAYQMARYADNPVSYSLGQVDISIPLYTVKSRELEVPISLTYNTGGIKVDEIPATVGLGWSLNAGGVITKTVVGLEDDANPSNGRFRGILSHDDVYNGGYSSYLFGILYNWYDSFWDRYTYNYNGNTGSFIVKITRGTNPTLEIEKTSVSDDKIELEYNNIGEITKFIITDAKGIKYHFTEIESISYDVIREPDDTSRWPQSPNYNTDSSWYLTEIVSPDETDTVIITYTDLGEWRKKMLSHSITYTSSNELPQGWSGNNATKSVSYYIYSGCKAIASIEFNGNIVTFDYAEHPVNLPPIDMGYSHSYYTMYIPRNNNWNKYLTSVAVKNMEGNTVWSAELESGYFGDNRLKLAGLKISGGTNGTQPSDGYRFSYYEEAVPSDRKYFARDMAGYFNGVRLNDHIIPYDPDGRQLANRTHNLEYAKQYSLKEIAGLLGSVTKYEYESNGSGNDVVGLRIKSIGTYDGTKLIKKRKFSYSSPIMTMPLDGGGVKNYSTYSAGMSDMGGAEPSPTNKYYLTIGSYPVLPGASPERAKRVYGEVTEDIYDGVSSETVRMKYAYDTSEVVYDYPDVLSCNPLTDPSLSQNALGKYLLTSIPHGDDGSGGYFKDITNYYKEKSVALTNLISKKYYKQTEGTFELVREETSGYDTANRSSFVTGLFVRNILTDYEGKGYPLILISSKTDCFYFDVEEEMSTTKLTRSAIIDYANGQPVKTSSTTYSYSDHSGFTVGSLSNLQLESLNLKSKKVISDGKEYLYKYYYPYSSPGSLIGDLYERNQIYTPLTEEVVLNDVDTTTTETTYRYFTPGSKSIIKPGTITTSLNGNVIQTLTVNRYDTCGNPVHVTLNGDKNTCYIWGYNGTTLVAEIKNATYLDVVRALGITTLDDILNRPTLTSADYNALLGMKNSSSLENAHVTIYEHYPLIGIKSVTDPSGRKMIYEYDASCRLRAIKEDMGNNNFNVIESYDYNLINTL